MNEPKPDCFFCVAAHESESPQTLVVHRSTYHLVMLNKHPYNSGHLMVAPRLHLADPSESSPEARDELWPVILHARDVLAKAYSPDGFNMGMNLGSAAGAGVPGHFHFHIVPRWKGDANFMGVVGDTRLVPEDLTKSWQRLRDLFQESVSEGSSLEQT